MGFDLKTLQKASFEDRTDVVPVPDLKDWFQEGEKPEMKIRGLTGEELARCNDAADHIQGVSNILEALQSNIKKEKIDGIREALGISEKVPADFAKRLSYFHYGTVEPDFDHGDAVLFAENFPVEFYEITNRILRLTGKGRQVKKKASTGKTRK